MERVLKIIDDMESDVDNYDVECNYHYYVVEYDGINNEVIVYIIEAYNIYDEDGTCSIKHNTDFVGKVTNVSDNDYITMLITYINQQQYNSYESLIDFKGLALY